MSTNVVSRTAPTSAAAADQFSFSDLQRLAKSVVASKLFGVKTEDEALSLLVISQAEGRHPALAIRDYHIIQGRPSLKADTMLARFQAAGGKVDWKKYTDTECVGVFSHPQAGSVTVDWTIERAKQIGLTSKDNWKNYPRAMLRARCISEGVRTCFPGIAVGIYTPEEIADGAEIDITPVGMETAVHQATASATALTDEERDQHFNAMSASKDLQTLMTAFQGAWRHASDAKDEGAKTAFKVIYEGCKSALSAPT